MLDAFFRKLKAFSTLTGDDKRFLTNICGTPRRVDPQTVLIRDGEEPDVVHLVLAGFACRFKQLKSGRRQITAILAPGDFCDLHVFVLKAMDHSVGTLTPATIVDISRPDVLGMIERPAIARALLMINLVDQAVLREWITNIGQRPAAQRMAHLFVELYLRLKLVGLVEGDHFELPITQLELADALGLSLVHTNKSLKRLRDDNVLTYSKGALKLLDVPRIIAISGFDPRYLHMGGGKR